MREYLEFECTPVLENCAQVGENDYYERTMKEASALIKQLRRQFPQLTEGIVLRVKGFSHDFGTYHQLVAYYNNDEEAEKVYELENKFPEYWDEEAKKELGII